MSGYTLLPPPPPIRKIVNVHLFTICCLAPPLSLFKFHVSFVPKVNLFMDMITARKYGKAFEVIA